MIPGRLYFSAAVRWLSITFLLAIPVGSGVSYVIGLMRPQNHRYVRILGSAPNAFPSAGYFVESGTTVAICYCYFSAHGRPQEGELYSIPGLKIHREWYFILDAGSGGAMLEIDARWWLLLLVNTPCLLLALTLVRLGVRRRYVPGHCCVCGYDLRATAERCPECGTGM